MTRNYYTTRNYEINHTTFGGLICESDFNTEFRKDNSKSKEGSSIASRIMSDWRFDEECRKNIENRKRGISKNE